MMKKVFAMMCLYGLIIGSGFAHHKFVSHEMEKVTQMNDRKQFISYVVQSDDTLWDIAMEYASPDFISINQYIEEVMKSNHLEDSKIKQGQLLLIPSYEANSNVLAGL